MSVGKILSSISNDYEQYVINSTHGPLENTIQTGGQGGSFGEISEEDYEYLLLFNKDLPMFHELPFRVLLHLPSMMTQLGSVQVTQDHFHFWAWTAEVLRKTNYEEDPIELDIERLFLLTIDYAVGRLTSTPASKRLREENKQIRQMVSPHARRGMLESHRAATQLSYPLLEGLLRRLCSDFVKVDGHIKPGKKILTMDGEQSNRPASNIGDLLHHYENRVAEVEIANSLEAIRSEMERYSTSKTGYEIINSWRHPHSHGGERLSGPEHVVMLNITSQLIWGSISKQEYINLNKSRYTETILNTDSLPSLRDFDYYPLKETRDLLVELDYTP